MHGLNLATMCKFFLALSLLLLVADPAPAYIGPGADVSFISYAMTLLMWMSVAFSAVLLWPLHALWRVIRRRKTRPTTTSSPESAPEQAHAASPSSP